MACQITIKGPVRLWRWRPGRGHCALTVRSAAMGSMTLVVAHMDPTLPHPSILHWPLPLHCGGGPVYSLCRSTMHASLLSPARLVTLGITVISPACFVLTLALTFAGGPLLGAGSHSPSLKIAVAPPSLAVAVTVNKADMAIFTRCGSGQHSTLDKPLWSINRDWWRQPLLSMSWIHVPPYISKLINLGVVVFCTSATSSIPN